MPSMTKRNCQRIRCVRARNLDPGQLKPHHMIHLPFVSVAHTDHRLLDGIRGVFAHAQPCLRRYQHRDAARLPQLQCARAILVDKSLLHRRAVWRVLRYHYAQLLMQTKQSLRQISTFRAANPVGDMRNAGARNRDHAPASVCPRHPC